MSRRLLACLAFVLALSMTGCAGTAAASRDATASATSDAVRTAIATAPTPAPAEPRQMLLVVTPDWDATTGQLQRFAFEHGKWKPVGAGFPISVGRSGLAWGEGLHDPQPGLAKREGDGRAPAGKFRIGPAFGYANADRTALPYLPMTATHYCMDVSGSPLYNQIVDSRQVGEAAVKGSTEPMRLDLVTPGDQRYRIGFVIEHNASGRAQGGSCIFAHVWKAPGAPTAGCTAMQDAAMRELLDWLDPAREPVLVQLPEVEYHRLRSAWKLPEIKLP
jgi:L,D-peptidoglycan transpeptidase YkuD (ErfK/YbiS/YcfS/YnhG family)